MTTVASLYNRFPFPKISVIPFSLHKYQDCAHRASLWSSRQPDTPQKMLVAGCGTVEALTWALSLPQTEVTAVDISESSLAKQQALAEALQLKNVKFLRKDLTEIEGLGEQFNFISSFGVLHHLPDPGKGLRALQNVLRPDGFLRLMVYNRMHRRHYQRIQIILQRMFPAGASWEAKLELSLKLLKELASFSNDLQATAKEMLGYAESNLPVLTDTVLHPQETAYTIPGLFKFLENAGLKMIAFENFLEWDESRTFKNPEILEVFTRLDQRQKYEYTNWIRPPYFVFYACSGDHPYLRPAILPLDVGKLKDLTIMPSRHQAYIPNPDGASLTLSEKRLEWLPSGDKPDSCRWVYGERQMESSPIIKSMIESVVSPVRVGDLVETILQSRNPAGHSERELLLSLRDLIYDVGLFQAASRGTARASARDGSQATRP